ncbi:DUF2157 domain-containing protein [Mucilaginibacter robiniae]|uniref:DUF2157 domain-containing protein n=1 Tax=Mucilaginibacter robiniae TaxID=2728022 RepID=A0A7L5DYZ1_9SPHI|nr:DUF2157 domain-containing protein [Mucilaginibacter robiniae]QJD94494.1 DUF2157 domain-containing protein [Mucilaginibacter robiniae]
MDQHIYENLHAEGLISDVSFERIKQHRQHPLFSIHWEVKTLLYVGIIMLTSGSGILIYKNIDTIGHQIILALIALITAGCYAYCFKHKKPFSFAKVQTPNTFFDYILLLGTLCFLIFLGYLQYQYHVFGNQYGLATLIPTLVLFYTAYAFDHIGILNMAIVNLGLCLGVSVNLKQLLSYQTFNSQSVIYTYLGFGLLMLLAAWLTQKYILKKHFAFSYQHYGIHVGFIALIANYFFNYNESASVIWLIVQIALGMYIYQDAIQNKSAYFILLSVLYSYFSLNCLLIRAIMWVAPNDFVGLLLMFFSGSAAGIIYLLVYISRKIRAL